MGFKLREEEAREPKSEEVAGTKGNSDKESWDFEKSKPKRDGNPSLVLFGCGLLFSPCLSTDTKTKCFFVGRA